MRTMPTRRCELDSREGELRNDIGDLSPLPNFFGAAVLLTTSPFTPNHWAMRFQHFQRVRPFSHSQTHSVSHSVRSALGRTFATCQEYGGGGGGAFLARVRA